MKLKKDQDSENNLSVQNAVKNNNKGTEIREKIIDYIGNYSRIDKKEINDNTDFFKDIDMSSMDIMQMCCYIDDEYHIEIPESKIYNMHTVNDVISYLNNALS